MSAPASNKTKAAPPGGDPFAFTFVRGNAPVEYSDDEDVPVTGTMAMPPPHDKTGHPSAMKSNSAAASSNHVRFPSDTKLCQTIPGQDEGKFVLFQALYDYHSKDPNDLSFAANDILRVSDQGDGPQSWFYGESQDGREGHFPGTYVRKIPMLAKQLSVDVETGFVTHSAAPAPSPALKAPAPASSPSASAVKANGEEKYVLYQALFDYKSDDADDLHFLQNDIIRVSDEGDGPKSWFYGSSQDGREGSFPGTFVRKIRMPGGNAVKQVAGLDHL